MHSQRGRRASTCLAVTLADVGAEDAKDMAATKTKRSRAGKTAKRTSRAKTKTSRARRAKIVAHAGALTVSEVDELEELRHELDRLASGRSPLRWNADPEDVQRSVAQLVLTLVEFIRRLLERQAIRRMESGTLTEQQTEDVGRALMTLEDTIRDIAATFGLEMDELNLDLGPVGKLM
jgi:hypothetical protein